MTGEWTIAVWSDSAEEQAVVRSMLNLLNRHAKDRWSIVDSSVADLLLLGRAAIDPPSEPRPDSRITARFAEPGEPPVADEALVLNRPLRVMPFLDLLNEAASRLHALRAATSYGVATATLSDDPFQTQLMVAQAIAGFRRNGPFSRPIALQGADGGTLALINLSRAAVASVHRMADLLTLLDQHYEQCALRDLGEWEQAVRENQPQSLDALCWQMGKNLAQRMGLAPWLHGEMAYRMVSWPDFGSIGNDRVGFELAAQLTQRALTPMQLSAAATVSLIEATSFFNSASLCGLLTVGGATGSGGAPSRAQPADRLSMIARLRSKLRL